MNIIPYRCLRDLESLAEGGFGIIYRAEHEDWGTVAYKELKTSIIKPESKLVPLHSVKLSIGYLICHIGHSGQLGL